MKALIVVDVQNDFCEGGALPVTGGNDVAFEIANFLYDYGFYYNFIVFSRDWHSGDSDNRGHFSDTPDYVNTWPKHCVETTIGAEFHPAIREWIDSYYQDRVYSSTELVMVKKGMDAPAYSAFEGTTSNHYCPKLQDYVTGLTAVHVCGLAFDYCVKQTAFDAANIAGTTVVLSDLTRGVSSDTVLEAERELRRAGVHINPTGDVFK